MTAARSDVSVAMTAFNGSEFIEEQIDSILRQSLAPRELVIGDDGSSDNTSTIIRSLAEKSSTPIRLLGGDHVGLRRNVERTIRACRGGVIALSDQDDLWQPGRIEAISRAFERDSVALWFSDADLIDSAGQRLRRSAFDAVRLDRAAQSAIAQGEGLARLLHGMTVPGATLAFRSRLRQVVLPLPIELDGDDHLYLHDGWIALLAYLLGETVVDASALTLYRQHARQVTAMAMTREDVGTEGHRDRRAQIDREYRQISLVHGRLLRTGALLSCRRADAAALSGRLRLLTVRTMPPGGGRTARILGELIRGDYFRYSRGVLSAASDLAFWR